ncbi:MAG: hypothetical protein Q8S73_31540 [Deltaproteobacteria bacterium]|nr:hypothetical protein [Myxococcales bacterium]MDP3218680.1 hypothetical protein [Deltaproteobacteria bacterium]
MTDDENTRARAIPRPLLDAAAYSPDLYAALHQHVAGGRPLPETLRDAHARLLRHAAEMSAMAELPVTAPMAWPEGPADQVTDAQVEAVLAALEAEQCAQQAATRRAETTGLPAMVLVLPSGELLHAFDDVRGRMGAR